MVMMGHQLERLVDSLKSKLKLFKAKKPRPYDKVDKTESMRVEICSRRAQKLIAKNLMASDSLGHKSFAF